MKKVLIAAALVGMIGFAGLQTATADPGYGCGYGPCQDYNIGRQFNDETTSKAREKFRDETTALRKEIVVKQSTLEALMHQDNPDEKKAAQLSGELFDLRTDLQNKAEERGITGGFGCGGRGPGMMGGGPGMMSGGPGTMSGGPGMMWRNGGPGRHMRGW